MEQNAKILIVLGIGITLILSFVNIYLAGIAGIIFIALLKSVLIMQDTKGIPEIDVHLREDAKGIILTNKGNARAVKVHVTLVPGNTEFDVPSLDPDATHEYRMDRMVEEIKVLITYSNEDGRPFSGSSLLSSLHEEPDLLRPVIPIFSWKK